MPSVQRSVSMLTSTTNEENNRRNNACVQRSMSVGGTADKPQSSLRISVLYGILVDIVAQLEKFIKEYPRVWNLGPNVQTNLSFAIYRLPAISSRLASNKLEDLEFAKSIMLNIRGNLPQTLKTGSQGSQEFTSDTGYLQQAIIRGDQAIQVCTSQNPNFQFGPIIDEDLHSSNDVMAAALILKQYFSNLLNCVVN